jgi:hypothetical protein
MEQSRITVTDFLDEKKREIRTRLSELKPLVEEYRRLEAAAAALEGVGAAKTTRATTVPARRTRSTSSSRSSSSGTGTARRGRPKGSGTRSKQTLELVRAQPGITIPELAAKMGIKQNYLYRVVPELVKDGQIRKEGRELHPVAASSASRSSS